MSATDSSCQDVDVGKLTRFFETLGASSLGTYTSDDFSYKFRGSVAGGGASVNKGPLCVPYSDDYKANSKQTATHPAVYFPSNTRGPTFSASNTRGPAFSEDVWMVSCVPCDKCSKEHVPYYCPDDPCKVCYKVHHPTNCPYFYHLPQGERFAPGYEVLCVCGNVFSEAKWRCTFCAGSRAVLKAKHCLVCDSIGKHGTYECPKDEVLAAELKSVRDQWLSEGFEFGRLCGYMKDG